MKALIDFYEQHHTSKKFYYVHPVYAVLTVRFKKPLEAPRSIKDGNGITEPFEILLIEQPV